MVLMAKSEVFNTLISMEPIDLTRGCGFKDVASRLATIVYVAMVTPILYDNSYYSNYSNLMKVIGLMVDFNKNRQTLALKYSMVNGKSHHRTSI